MENLDILTGAKNLELVAFREHPYRKGCDVLKHVGEIKDYENVVYDSENKCILFLKYDKKGRMKIVDRLQKESVVKIYKNSLGVVVLVD